MKKKNIIILTVTLICLIILLLNITTPNMRVKRTLENIDNTKTIMIYQYIEEYDKNAFTEETNKNVIEYNNQYYSPKIIIKDTETIDKLVKIFKKIEANPGEMVAIPTESSTITYGYIFRLLDENSNEIIQINYKSTYINISIKDLTDNVKLASEYQEELNEIINTLVDSES